MKRIQDKIKDLVEPQTFEQVGNYAEDPAQALAAYRFTDVTSDLLSRWLDALADLAPEAGAALALAGARGAGKSHTLAVLGALAGSERLRTSVEDAHVAAGAKRLAGRRCAVVRVERGTRPTLTEELGAAFAAYFGGGEAQWGRDPAQALTVAASRATGETLVVIVDTAFNRPARVARDDGPVLGALAQAARGLNVFLALALDDDIAGADGANVAIVSAYHIDYLDPENLYRVADQFVLRKRPQVGDTLREIYQHLRSTVYDFNWSQSRFAALYPVHPLVAESAPGVRLYVPAFSFLSFASGAAARAAQRPALSLVLLDEVFDATEQELRQSAELTPAFETYERLTESCIAQLPVMQRYQARLILKSLFVLSLDGRGATPREMCAALLLGDDGAKGNATRQVGDILAQFARAADAGQLAESVAAGSETRYQFQISSHEAHDTHDTHAAAPPALPSSADLHRAPEAERGDDGAQRTASRDGARQATSGAQQAASDDGAQRATGGEGRPQAGASQAAVDAARQSSAQHQPGRQSSAQQSSGQQSPAAAQASSGAAQTSATQAPHGAAQTSHGAAQASPGAGGQVSGEAQPLAEEMVEWARLLTGKPSLGAGGGAAAREEVQEALGSWLDEWRRRGLRQKFEALPDGCLSKRVWGADGEVRKGFGRTAAALEAVLVGKLTLEEGLTRVADAFRRSPELFAARARALEDLTEFVEGFAARERVRAYIAAAEPTGVAEIETARRELLDIAEDPNGFLDAATRERFGRLWREFRARYGEHYAAAHDKTVGAGGARESLRALRRGARWREFESLSRLPVVSTQVWRQAEDLLRVAAGARCELPVRKLLESQPSCACRFRLAQAEELSELPQEVEALMERGLAVYRRTLLMLGANLAISLDALARREEEEETAHRARTLSTAFAQGRPPERFSRADVLLVERALRRMTAPPPVRVVAPNGDAGLLTREELRARFEQWLDELPEQPVLIEVVSKAEIGAP
jgi:hypothetical protein